jgi:bleomycin hydrolase
MKKLFLLAAIVTFGSMVIAQPAAPGGRFTIQKTVPVTSVKNQASTGTCWCFSSTSLLESQCFKKNIGEMDISEMFTVRNIYIEKAKNYILRQGHTQFGEGGLGHDVIRAVALYGAVPESVYSGLKDGKKLHDHGKMVTQLKDYLDEILKVTPVPANWLDGYVKILDNGIGAPPASFEFKGKQYTPQTFAKDVLKFNASDYVNLTSFTDHPYYEPFVIQVPDNFSNGEYNNLPLDEMISVVKEAVKGGYSVLWDTDVSNDGFMQDHGVAVFSDAGSMGDKKNVDAGNAPEKKWDAETRQQLFENLTTQDDHLMHIVGLETSSTGKQYFLVKNSWGDTGPDHGYINVSEAYLAINTISLIVPKEALSKELLGKLKVK